MNRSFYILLTLAAVMLASTPARAVKIADLTRIYGQQNNVLMGIGLVFGLKGTGDGGDYMPAVRPLQAMLEKYNDPASLAELSKGNNIALVTVTVSLPSNGVRRGDRLDCRVLSMGAATSLRGGHLIFTPLTSKPGAPVFGLAEGTVTLEDAATPTSGIVKGGFQAEQNLFQPLIQKDRYIVLVIDDVHASWGLASTMAKIINDDASPDGNPIAIARDPRTVEITIPESERQYPDGFIARVQRLPVPVMPQEARVIINTKTSSIVVTGDVEISPGVISYKGLSITTVVPKPVPSSRAPVVSQVNSIPIETGAQGQPNARLDDLVAALEQLRVPTPDRIEILKTLHQSGKLHAKLFIDGVAP